MIQPPEGVEAFEAGLTDPTAEVRVIASAGWMKAAAVPATAGPALVEALRDPEAQVRANAAHALARLDELPSEAVPGASRVSERPQRRHPVERGAGPPARPAGRGRGPDGSPPRRPERARPAGGRGRGSGRRLRQRAGRSGGPRGGRRPVPTGWRCRATSGCKSCGVSSATRTYFARSKPCRGTRRKNSTGDATTNLPANPLTRLPVAQHF